MELALITDVPQLCARHVRSLWLGRSPRGELLCWQDRVLNWAGNLLIGGERGDMAPSDQGICPGLLTSCAKTARRTGVPGVQWYQGARGFGGAEGAKGAWALGVQRVLGE